MKAKDWELKVILNYIEHSRSAWTAIKHNLKRSKIIQWLNKLDIIKIIIIATTIEPTCLRKELRAISCVTEQSTDDIRDRTACAESSLVQQWQFTKKDTLSLNKEKHKREQKMVMIFSERKHTTEIWTSVRTEEIQKWFPISPSSGGETDESLSSKSTQWVPGQSNIVWASLGRIKSLLGVPAPIPYKEKRRGERRKGWDKRTACKDESLNSPPEASPPPLRRQAFYSLELRS